MELCQVYWDDQRNLFLDFQKDGEMDKLILPETVKRLNLKYEITKVEDNDKFADDLPSLVSIKQFHLTNKNLAFSIDLNDLINPDDLQINFLRLTVFLNSGDRQDITIKKNYNLSEICVEDDYYTPFTIVRQEPESELAASISQEQILHTVETVNESNSTRNTYIYRKNRTEIMAGPKELIALIYENNERLKRVEEQLQTLSNLLQDVKINGPSVIPANPLPIKSGLPPIQRIKRLPAPIKKAAQRAPFLAELKTVINKSIEENNGFNFRSFLKPMSEEELNKITLDDDKLKEKELELFARQVSRIEETEIICIEKLKKPK